MMICPMSVYDELKDKSVEEIKSAIRGFKQMIGKLKKKIERERFFPAEVHICPSDDVVLSCTREYLEIAIKALEEKGVKYKRSQAEEKSVLFNDRIAEIVEINLRIGSWCMPHFYTFTIKEGRVEKSEYDLTNPIYLDVDAFQFELKKLYLGEWRAYYSPERFGIHILDGAQWELKVTFADGKSKSWGGSNDYPYNFEVLLNLLQIADCDCNDW